MEQKKGNTANIRERLNIEEMLKHKKDLIEIRLFRKSLYFKALEQAALLGEDVIFRADSEKFDLDSDEGQAVCKNYLGCIERLCSILQIKTSSKKYRDKFSKAYKVLYCED